MIQLDSYYQIIMIYLKVGFTPRDNMGIIIPLLVWGLNYWSLKRKLKFYFVHTREYIRNNPIRLL